MSEQKLRDAFDHMGPDEAARQRMLQNILADHEAAGREHAQPDEQPVIVAFAPEGEVQAPARFEEKPRRRREFFWYRVAFPLAACLLLVAIVPPVLPQLATVVGDITSPPPVASTTSNPPAVTTPDNQQPLQKPEDQQTTEEQTGNTAPGDTVGTTPPPDATENPPEGTEGEPAIVEVPALVVPAPEAPGPASDIVFSMSPAYSPLPSSTWPSTLLDYASLALSLLACLAALIIAISGIISWWRKNKRNSVAKKHE